MAASTVVSIDFQTSPFNKQDDKWSEIYVYVCIVLVPIEESVMLLHFVYFSTARCFRRGSGGI